MIRLGPILLLSALASRVFAQDTTVTLWTREVVHSDKLKEERAVYVVTPEGYSPGTQHYPVLVVLDAQDRPQFSLALANVAFLASREEIPPLIVVGISNAGDRIRDLGPAASGATAREFPTAGGDAIFADFILDELIPFIRSKYRTLPATFLAGHSAGGLFGLAIAAKKPGSFAGIIAMSPALWWNDSSLVAPYADAIAKSAKSQRLFVTSGSLETGIDLTARRFSVRLDSLKPAFTVFGHRHYSGDTHGLTPAASLVDGLRFVFDPVSVAKLPISGWWDPPRDSATVMRAVVESERRYTAGARALGLSERLPESLLNRAGYYALELKKPAFAVWVFRKNVALYPESANAYDSLGDGLLASGDTTAAIAQFRRAVDLATRTRHWILEESRRKLNALEAAKSKR